jgi:hypothetical protein
MTSGSCTAASGSGCCRGYSQTTEVRERISELEGDDLGGGRADIDADDNPRVRRRTVLGHLVMVREGSAYAAVVARSCPGVTGYPKAFTAEA